MATVKKQNICVGTKYTDAQGQEKTRWTTIGKAFHSDKGGISLKIEVWPACNWDGFAQLFDEQNNNQQAGYQQSGYPQQPAQPVHQPVDFYAQQGGAYPQQGNGMQSNTQFMPQQQAPAGRMPQQTQQGMPMQNGMPWQNAGGDDNTPF